MVYRVGFAPRPSRTEKKIIIKTQTKKMYITYLVLSPTETVSSGSEGVGGGGGYFSVFPGNVIFLSKIFLSQPSN